MEMHSNVPHRRVLNNQVLLYPRGPKDAEPVIGNVTVTWLRGTSDESWQSLVDAFEAYSSGRFQSTIIPANVAVESMLAKAFDGFLKTFLSKNKLDDYWEKQVTYSVQSNILLPMLAHVGKAPALPANPSLLGELNRLRSLRNQLGHSGKLDKPLERNETARLLTSAVIGFWYMYELSTTLVV